MYTVVIVLDVAADAVEAVTAHSRQHAHRCLATEAGCLSYEVHQDRYQSRLVNIGRFADESAFHAHQASEHTATFNVQVNQMAATRTTIESATLLQETPHVS